MNKHIIEPETKLKSPMDLFDSRIEKHNKLIAESRAWVNRFSKLFTHSESIGE